ncbi:hypothetical protein ACWEV4_35085 [Streptomyces sp. NPDC003860]
MLSTRRTPATKRGNSSNSVRRLYTVVEGTSTSTESSIFATPLSS